MAKVNFRQKVAEEMLELIAKGTAPWQKPWDPNKVRSKPFNPTSEKTYRGMNSFVLEMQGYSDPRWLTYKQAAAMGAQVRKGEKATQIEYWQWTKQQALFEQDGKPKLDEDGKQLYQTVKLQRPSTFRASVFNAEQIDGMPDFEQPPLSFDPVEKAEEILSGIDVPIHHDQADRCFYRGGSSDEIHMVPKEGFENAYNYYAVALHEVGHSTGHESRLNRDMGNIFGSEKYAIEELRAEMASYMLTTELGLGHNPERHAPYIKSWMKAIENDKNILFQAARDAEQITEWVLNKDKRLELAKGATMAKEAQDMQQNEGKSFFGKLVTKGKELFTKDEPEQTQESPEVTEERTYLDVNYMERKKAKAAGAKWDKDAKKWYVVGDTSRVTQWLPEEQSIKVNITVDPTEIGMAKEIGLLENNGQWQYTFDSNALNMDRKYYQTARLNTIDNSEAKYHKEINELFDNAERNRSQAMNYLKTKQEVSFEVLNDTLATIADSEAVLNYTTSEFVTTQQKERQYLNVPYDERHEAKKAGAKWDRKAKSWYAPEGVDGLQQWSPENTKVVAPALDPQEEFKQALQDHGFVVDGLPEMDGEWHRVPLEDDSKGKKSGSYRGFLDGIPNGQMKNFKDGQEAHQWVATGSQLSDAERAEMKREAELRKAERAEKLLAKQKEVAKTAYGRAVNAKEASANHPYLQKKGIKPNGLKYHEKTNTIMVPLQDTAGFIWSTQSINEQGDKLFLKESRKEGLFHVMGDMDLKTAKDITICEGVATGASIHEATNKPVIIAFDGGNLKPVAEAIRKVNPEARILIAADNDHVQARKPTQKINIGIEKAKEAAAAVDGDYTFPSFTKEQKAQKLTDYNDLAQDKGVKALVKALKPLKKDLKQKMDRS